MLELRKITKSVGDKTLYHDVSFCFRQGCYAMIGKNGIGKTVLMEMLAGVLRPDSGTICLDGVGNSLSKKHKQKLTYIPSAPLFFPTATGAEFLSFIVSIKRANKSQEKIYELINRFRLSTHLHSRFNEMSLGTQKKLFLTTLGIGDSQLIILDEPTNALDSESNQFLYEIIQELSKSAIVILATHDQGLLKIIKPIIIQLKSNPITQLTQFS